jgi:sugar (pentulose or hexulose) kinase
VTSLGFLGIDIGTQGARVMAIDEAGAVVAEHRVPFESVAASEQDPEIWWRAVLIGLSLVARQLRTSNITIASLSVTGTSGTILPLDRLFNPLHPALMYHDPRSQAEAERVNEQTSLSMNASWSLPKILWFLREFPDLAPKVRYWRHPTDFILGRLTGVWDVTDETSALKTGYDPVMRSWPTEAMTVLGIDVSQLPNVIPSGRPIGTILSSVCNDTGMPPSIIITTGMTDGCASQVASGAVQPGMWNTTIGTTMVIKGTSAKQIHDPLHRIYSHRHPDGWWLPGAASNTGASWISIDFPSADLAQMNEAARRLTPTGLALYPLRATSERFPFVAPHAEGFEPPDLDLEYRFAASLEGVAYLERMSYELFEHLSATRIDSIVSSGGGSRSETWLQIRSDVLGRPIRRARHAEGAVGAAIVGASRTIFSSLIEATSTLTGFDLAVEPSNDHGNAYDHGYVAFVQELRNRGYVTAD